MMTKACAAPGCDKAKRPRGRYCAMHRNRVQRHGDLDAFTPGTRGHLSDEAGYRAAHVRVRRAKGPAEAHLCVLCGGPASEWAYDGLDPDERLGASGRSVCLYSLAPDHYQPMCAGCHRRFDAERRASR